MVRVAGQTPTMDNREDLLDALNDFTRKQPKEIPPLLEQYLKQVAKTGETLFPWSLLKGLFVAKLEQVMQQFSDEFGSDHIPPCPNVENARFEVYRQRIMEAVQRFHGAPFTVQRLCELLTDPKRHYKRCDKFMRGLEKNILVVSTVDPFGKKVVSEGKTMVNGMDTNNSASPTLEEASPATAASSTPPVPVWNTSGPTTIWPLGVDGAATDVTTSSMMLEVSETPGPSDVSPVITSPTSATDVVTGPTESGSPSDVSSSGAIESTADNLNSTTPTVTVNGMDTLSSEAAAMPVVEAGPDSSVHQVAAEEMVTGDGVAVPTSQEAPVDTVVHESVVETSPNEAPPGEATAHSADTVSAAHTDCLSTIQEREADAVPCSTPEEGSEVDSSVASSVEPPAVSAKHPESPAKIPPASNDSSTEVQAASSSEAVLPETASASFPASDAAEVCSIQHQEQTARQDDSSADVHAVGETSSSDASVSTPSNAAVSSSEDVPTATSPVDAPTSSTTTSSEEQTSDEGASAFVTMDADSVDSSNSASAESEADKPVSTEDSMQITSEPVSDSSLEAMEQD